MKPLVQFYVNYEFDSVLCDRDIKFMFKRIRIGSDVDSSLDANVLH